MQAPKKGYVRLYHGGWASDPITEIRPSDDIVTAPNQIFGGLFALPGGPGAYGDGTTYYMDVPEEKILTTFEMVYGEEGEAAVEALKKVMWWLESEEDFEIAYTAVIEDYYGKLDTDDLMRVFEKPDRAYASWEAQNIRGQVAHLMGYQAVEMSDENGISYLVLPGVKVHLVPRENPARARRTEERSTKKRSVDEFGEVWVDTEYERIYHPPFLTEGHFDLPMVKEAARIASRAKESKRLGRGHYGEAFLVETSKGPVTVKVAAERMLHQGQLPWTLEEQRANLMHEAGVTNELEDMGYAIVPRSVYVELEDGTPAIVREYGEEVEPGEISGREFYELESALFSLEQETGWRIQDALLLLRRPDGSLFIGDVGIWDAPDVGQQRAWDSTESRLPGLLEDLGKRLFGQRFWSLARVQRLQERLEEHRREMRDPDHFITKMFLKDLEKALISREAVGIPSPSKAYQILESARYGE